LKDGEFLVVCDFSENYSFVLQDEVQSHHWNVQQATIHPFVIYFKENMEVEHLSFIIISEDLRHDSVAVNLFISKLITFLRENQGKIVNKIYFISDGAASQYKNRKKTFQVFVNLNQIMELKRSGISLQHRMEKVLVTLLEARLNVWLLEPV
jgi:hypothetical protein